MRKGSEIGANHVRPPRVNAEDFREGFATADDGLRLYWHAVGSGPAIVCCNGVGVSTFFWKYVTEAFVGQHTIVTWDYRGHGKSDAIADAWGGDVTIPRHAADLAVVMDAAGVDDALLVGHSMGCQVIFELYRLHPERIRGLVTILGTAGRALETFYDNPSSPRYFRLAERAIRRMGDNVHTLIRPVLLSPIAWTIAKAGRMVDPDYAEKTDMLPYMAHLATLDFRMFIRTILSMQDHDAWDVLPAITAPVLVVAAEKDAFTPMWLSRKMAANIHDADFLVLADGSHAAIIEQPDTINHRLKRFLRERKVFG